MFLSGKAEMAVETRQVFILHLDLGRLQSMELSVQDAGPARRAVPAIHFAAM